MTFNNQYEFDRLVQMVGDRLGAGKPALPDGCCPPSNVILPGAPIFSLFTQDTNSLALLGKGTQLLPLSGNVKISAAAGNSLTVNSDGLYVPPIFGGGGGTGSVTIFSAGNLSPLFTTNVTNPETTPNLSFSLTNAPANTYFGNKTNVTGAPIYNTAGALTKTDDANIVLSLTGSPSNALLNSVNIGVAWQGVLPLSRGGTGASLTTPNHDVIMFYDSSAGSMSFLNVGDGLTIRGTTIEADAAVVTEIYPKEFASFIVGSTGMTAGSITYTNSGLSGKQTNEVLVFVDGIKVYPNLADRFSYVLVGNTIEFNSGLAAGTSVQMYLIPPDPAPTVQTIYYGAKATAGTPSASQILAGLSTSQDGSDDVIIDFTPFNSTPQYLWFAIPDLGEDYRKYTWLDSEINNGNIGSTPTDTFGAPVIVTASGNNYLVITTNFATQFTVPLTMI